MTQTAHTMSPSSPAVPGEAGVASLGLAAAARAISCGDITAEAYARALLQRAREEADLNAFTTIDEDALLEAALAADTARAAGSLAPLLGVPLGIKDSYLTKDLPTTLGLAALASFTPREDADVVRAMRAAGALVFGKNNLVEMSFGLTGHNERYGQVKNPAARDRVSGGSSSGSAASVAAGIVPASLGGDTVGSMRVPAALCGAVGFKPTTGRWPRGGVAPISHTLDTTGALARAVEDCALLDQIVTFSPSVSLAAAAADLRGVRLAHAPRQFLDQVEPEVASRFQTAVTLLRQAGADIVEIDLGEDFVALSRTATWSIFLYETMGAVSGFLRDHDVPITFEAIVDGLKPGLQSAWRAMVLPDGPGAISAEAYGEALTVTRPEIRRRLDAAFAEHGAHATIQPTTPCPAPLIEQQAEFHIGEREVNDLALADHTLVASLTGLPGISLPAGRSPLGLPIGLELDAPADSDPALLDLASRVEKVWAGRLA